MSRDLPLRVRAFAKINLTLRVLGCRSDGYHEVRTVLQTLSLHDRLTFERATGPFTIQCADPACPTDRTNLVWRAAELLWRAAGRRGAPRDVRVVIEKQIPVQAGLGGGSSDAAAALRVLADLWCPQMTEDQLADRGRALGADVPFFLRGGTALGVERGDRLFALADPPPAWVLLVRPDFGISTVDAYRWFDEAAASPPATPTASWLRKGPYADGGNDLQGPVTDRHPEIGRIVRALDRYGAVWAAMSGSGSACFGMFGSRRQAQAAATALAKPRRWIVVTKTQSATECERAFRSTSVVRRR
jgi:4-diphosphocytidyl-2-C-methyl-D-erythritol kinase